MLCNDGVVAESLTTPLKALKVNEALGDIFERVKCGGMPRYSERSEHSETSTQLTDVATEVFPDTVALYEFTLTLSEEDKKTTATDAFPTCWETACKDQPDGLQNEVSCLQPFVNSAIGTPLREALEGVVYSTSSSQVAKLPDFTLHDHINSAITSASKEEADPKNHFLMGEIKLHWKIKEIENLVEDEYDKNSKSYKLVKQLFSYMLANKCRYGLLTSIESSWVFYCENGKDLSISQRFHKDDCIKVFIAVALLAKRCGFMSLSSSVSSDHTEGGEVDEDNTDINPDGATRKPFTSSNAANTSKGGSGKGGSGKGGSGKDGSGEHNTKLVVGNFDDILSNNPRYFLELPVVAPCSHAGSTWKATLGGDTVVIKTCNVYKQKHLCCAMTNEIGIYGRLVDLQGEFIPTLLYSGWIFPGLLYGFVVSDCGSSLDTVDRENVNPLTNERILAALEAIHKKQVLHNDLARRNIVFTDENNIRIIDFGQSKVVTDSKLLLQESECVSGLR